MKPSRTHAVLLVLLFMAFSAASSRAQDRDRYELPEGEMHAGVLELRPVVQITETYDSNIFQENANEVDDFITDILGELTIGLPMQNLMFIGGGYFDVFAYADTDQQDRTDYGLFGSVGGEFPGGLGFRVGDEYSRNWLMPSEQSRVEEGEEYKLNEFSALLDYKMQQRFRVAAGYDNNDYNYNLSEDRDRNEDVLTGTFYWHFAPKTSALAEYVYSDFNYDTNTIQDNKSHGFFGGLTWEATGKSTGELKAGYEFKNYDDETITRDDEYFVLIGRFIYALSSRSTLRASARRASEETDFIGNPYYVSNSLHGDIEHDVTAKTYLTAGLTFSRDDYPNAVSLDGLTADRSDDAWYLGAGIGWDPIRWLGFKLDYQYGTRDSNFALYDYDQHQLSLSGKAAF